MVVADQNDRPLVSEPLITIGQSAANVLGQLTPELTDPASQTRDESKQSGPE